MRIISPQGGLGDELGVTACLEPLRVQMPLEHFTFEKFIYPEIFLHHPFATGGTKDGGLTIALRNDILVESSTITRKMARQLGVRLLDDSPKVYLTPSERQRDYGVSLHRRSVAIDSWSHDPMRRWANYEELAGRLQEEGWQVIEVGRNVPGWAARPKIPCGLSLVDELTVRETAAVLAGCTLFIGNDSGLFHLAAAVGTPQVAIFGRTPWRRRRYWNTTPLGNEFDYCVNCVNKCPYDSGKGSACLAIVTVEDVLAAAELAVTRFPRRAQ